MGRINATIRAIGIGAAFAFAAAATGDEPAPAANSLQSHCETMAEPLYKGVRELKEIYEGIQEQEGDNLKINAYQLAEGDALGSYLLRIESGPSTNYVLVDPAETGFCYISEQSYFEILDKKRINLLPDMDTERGQRPADPSI